MKNILMLQKKGQAKVDNKITYLIGALIIVVLATALAPTMFSNIVGTEKVYNESVNSSGECIANCSTPDWVPVIMFVIVGAGLVFLIWRSFNE